ncbi:MAG TPA: acyl-CoA dehydrogenase [Microbacterium sp.]|nr:acyl-CoA dehydrogenase [Microbacterium sp.]
MPHTPASSALEASPLDSVPVDADVAEILRVAAHASGELPLPGRGQTLVLWDALAGLAARSVEAARIVEPHLDAIAILAQAREDGADLGRLDGMSDAASPATWGVFAAEGAGVHLQARRESDEWRLSGTKPWCSLAGTLSHALVTAWVDDENRQLFAVDLRDPDVRPRTGPWVSRGLHRVVSAPVDFDAAPAQPIGDVGWYLRRPGFSWGGIGVAAIWWGGAAPLVTAIADAARSERADQAAHVYAGRADAAQWTARLALEHAAARVDAGARADPAESKLLAARVRAVVADAADEIIALADRALGPAPLTTDDAHAGRVADLRIYLRQHHAERDLARLGAAAVRS